MKSFLARLRDKIYGNDEHIVDQDRGPASIAYIRSWFPSSGMTKKLTLNRVQGIQRAFAFLRPDQQRIAVMMGYDKGVCGKLLKPTQEKPNEQ